MADDAVFEMQSYLRNIGRLDSDISTVVPDGIFGEETTAAVKSFQKKYGLAETGIVDFAVWESIKNKSAEAVFTYSEPAQVAPIKNSDLPLITGTDNALVYTLHLMLNSVAARYKNFTPLPVQSAFDSATQEQVRLWQRVAALEESGQVDKKTWNSLAAMYLLPLE